MNNYKINDNLFLISQAIPVANDPKIVVPAGTNHLIAVDVSGSMSYDLPNIREQLKRKLPKLLKQSDTISIIWFSGRGQCGILLEAEPVATLTDLKDVEAAIDRWLKPVGMTGFKEPLDLIPGLVDRVAKKNANSFGLWFMSDGCDNVSNRQDILTSVEAAGKKLSSSTFVEYGYYADRPLLTAMAEKCGGSLIFAQDFDQYAPSFEAAMQKHASGAKKVELAIGGDPICGFAFALKDGEILAFSVEGGKIEVPEDLGDVLYLSQSAAGGFKTDLRQDKGKGAAVYSFVYGAISLYAQRMKSDIVFPLLKVTGDVHFIEKFAACFGKQAYSTFVDETKQAAFDPALRLVKGYDPNKVPADDAFTVLDLLRVLASDEENRVLLDSKDFKYSRIGRGRIDANEVLTADEQAEIAALTEQLKSIKDVKTAKEISAKIEAITASKGDSLKFVPDKYEDGYPISNLVYNEERPNVSMLVRKPGTVDLSSRSAPSGVPTEFRTHIYRNYTIIKDGLVNIDKLPVRLTAGTIRLLKDQGLPAEAIVGLDGEAPEVARKRATKASDTRPVSIAFDLKALPIINRKMVKDVSAKKLFELELKLFESRCAQKVYNTYKKELSPIASAAGLAQLYGEPSAIWLKEQGITDGGFSPKVVQAPSTDFYMGKELKISAKGLSKVPSLNDYKKAKEAGKSLTPALSFMAMFASACNDVATNNPEAFKEYVEAHQKLWTDNTRGIIFAMSQARFAIVVGQTWPYEFKSLDENQMKVDYAGHTFDCKLELNEIEVKI